jgi:hypothetical protein
MSDPGDAVRKYLAQLTTQSTMRAKNFKAVRRLGLVWMDGHERLYKFKSFSGDSRKHVLDMILSYNPRLEFSAAIEASSSALLMCSVPTISPSEAEANAYCKMIT